jgi:predicted transcriptional regulator
MNTPEFRLLTIWQNVVEMKDVQLKMSAYKKIAMQVGITERHVRENIRKLVEHGYLVATETWYELNFDNDFIKCIVENSALVTDQKKIELNEIIFEKFHNTFGIEATKAIDFYKNEVLKEFAQTDGLSRL